MILDHFIHRLNMQEYMQRGFGCLQLKCLYLLSGFQAHSRHVKDLLVLLQKNKCLFWGEDPKKSTTAFVIYVFSGEMPLKQKGRNNESLAFFSRVKTTAPPQKTKTRPRSRFAGVPCNVPEEVPEEERRGTAFWRSCFARGCLELPFPAPPPQKKKTRMANRGLTNPV